MQESTPLAEFGTRQWRRLLRGFNRATRWQPFRKWYAVSAVAVLGATAVFWAVLGARLQLHNADQLSDPYLFTSWSTFHGAQFPAAHTMLLKWPLFWLLGWVGVTPRSITLATVGLVLLTLAVLVYVLYRIDRRPLVFGTVCLGLALALLLVPAQPYAGGILPVNMAMLTTRNLEYAVYLTALVLFATAVRLRSLRFVFGVLLLALLFASDKLFLSLSLGGALLALLCYALFSNWSLTTFAVRWLLASIVGALGATAILTAISAGHVTHLVGSSSPYGLVHGPQGVVLGIAYAVLGLLTSAGANPAYDNTVLSHLPHDMWRAAWNLSSVAYVVTAGLLVYALVLVWQLMRPTVRAVARRVRVPKAILLALALVWSTVAALGVFVSSDHYYAVDARYLAIGLFALVVAVSVRLRTVRWHWAEDLLVIACALLATIALAVVTTLHVYHGQMAALATIDQRNELVATTLQRRKVTVLVGDYWRVMPIKLASHDQLTVSPLGDCTQPISTLTSGAWQPDLTKRRFAYLVTLDDSLTNFPRCTLEQITARYGRPNATQIIAGTAAKPAEALLFYDAGSHPTTLATAPAPSVSPLLPINPDQLTKTNCAAPTIFNVVAHQDDDLLFLSPDLQHQIHAGNCVRTVYLTAGDAGFDRLYWLSRQLGAESAYSNILGKEEVWDQQTVEIAWHEYVTVATPHDSSQVSLIFINLPDGNLSGKGFPATDWQSLAKLHAHELPRLRTVDGQSTYTYDQLVSTLATLMDIYQPAEIHTQGDPSGGPHLDHPDHIAAGQFADLAAIQYDQRRFGDAVTIPVTYYIGYPIQDYETNLSSDDVRQKAAAFFAYGQHDGGVCVSMSACNDATYGLYLQRQYRLNE
jgi:LmbE family N-acetylglucosaminyl deacetylase